MSLSRSRRIAAALACVSILAGVSGAVIRSSQAASITAKRTLTIAGQASDEGAVTNPGRAGAGPGRDGGFFVYQSFMKKSSSGVSPALATSWHYVGSDDKVFEFNLRHNMRYSDGTPVTAQNVAKWLTYNNAHYPGGGINSLGVASVTAIGRWTVRLHFKAGTADVPTLLSIYGSTAVSPKALAHISRLSDTSDGVGPYMVDPSKTVPGDHYTFVPNPYYYDKSQAKWAKVVVKVITNPSSVLQAFQAGQLDYALANPETAPAAQKAGIRVLSRPIGTATVWFCPGTNGQPFTQPALNDVRVRQALNYAIDRKSLTRAMVGQFGVPQAQEGWINRDVKLDNSYSYDPAKARSLLAAAGYSTGLKLGLIAQTSDNAQTKTLEQGVVGYLQAVGVDVTITTVDPSQWVSTITSGKSDLWIFGGFGAFPQTWTGVITLLKTAGWNDALINRLMSHLTKTSDTAVQAKIERQIITRFTQQAYSVPVANTDQILFVGKHLGGVEIDPNPSFESNNPVFWYPK